MTSVEKKSVWSVLIAGEMQGCLCTKLSAKSPVTSKAENLTVKPMRQTQPHDNWWCLNTQLSTQQIYRSPGISKMHGFAKGTRCKQRMWPSSRLSHSSHFRCSHLRMPFFFPRRILCSSASLKIMMRICLPFIIMVFHNIAHQQCSSMYWYEVTLLWICI